MTAVTAHCDERCDEKSRGVIGNSLRAVGELTLRLALKAGSRKARDVGHPALVVPARSKAGPPVPSESTIAVSQPQSPGGWPRLHRPH
jgi:hypothetical protein